MSEMPLEARRDLGNRIRGSKQSVAEKVTDEFLTRHPDWLERFGENVRKFGIEDANYHLDFLAGALEGGTVSSFEDYIRWTSRVLAARNIPGHFIAENLLQIDSELRRLLPPEYHPILGRFIAAGAAACTAGAEPGPAETGTDPLALAGRIFLQAILAGERNAALNVALEAHKAGHDLRDIYLEIFQKSLYAVGRLWESNQISVADEHMATAITQYVVARMYEKLPASDGSRGRVVVAGVQGELHQVGANMVADMLEADMWNVRFLGSNMPVDGIIKTIKDHEATLFGLSATMLFNLPQVIALIEKIRSETGTSAPRIILGGAAFRLLPELPAELRVDAVATDLRQGVELARKISS